MPTVAQSDCTQVGDAFEARRDLLLLPPCLVWSSWSPSLAAILDLLVANIAIASLMLINAITQRKALTSFCVVAGHPLWLVLNIASTRLILGADASSPAAVGEVVGAVISGFGGLWPVVIDRWVHHLRDLVVVQFVVITKGATRMSEVTAVHLVLPGNRWPSMKIVGGPIGARSHASPGNHRQADFYGAMDGASVCAAVAGLTTESTGGAFVGVWLKGWTFAETVSRA